MATLDDISLKVDALSDYVRAAFAPQVGSSWEWTYDQADTEVSFADHDFGALITNLVLGSAGALRLVDVTYTVGFGDGQEGLCTSVFRDVLTALEQRGEVDGIGFHLLNITPDSVVLPGTHLMAALPYPLVREFTVFQVDMTWESTVTGERADKDIHLVPRLDPPLPGRRSVPPLRTATDVRALRADNSTAM